MTGFSCIEWRLSLATVRRGSLLFLRLRPASFCGARGLEVHQIAQGSFFLRRSDRDNMTWMHPQDHHYHEH